MCGTEETHLRKLETPEFRPLVCDTTLIKTVSD